MTTDFTEPTSLVPPAEQAPRLSEEQLHQVFVAACEFVAAAIAQRPERLTDNSLAGADAVTVMGAFVTLKRSGRLRACCGTLGRPMRLFHALREAALRTATDDIRLPTISPMELSYLDVEVSLLHSFVPISLPAAARADAVAVGRHGLQIQRGSAAGLLLPSVGREHGFTAEEFLRQVCIKAGLPTSAWQEEDASIQTFEAVPISRTLRHGIAGRRCLGPTRYCPGRTATIDRSLGRQSGSLWRRARLPATTWPIARTARSTP